jgi:hypothetical protein
MNTHKRVAASYFAATLNFYFSDLIFLLYFVVTLVAALTESWKYAIIQFVIIIFAKKYCVLVLNS